MCRDNSSRKDMVWILTWFFISFSFLSLGPSALWTTVLTFTAIGVVGETFTAIRVVKRPPQPSGCVEGCQYKRIIQVK